MHILVVGAGIIGLATAFELKTAGHAVRVIDPDPAGGASHAAAGMLAPAAETVWGQHALHPLMVQAAADYPQFIDRIEAITTERPDYRDNATLVVAAEAADRQALNELESLQQSLGLRTERLLGSQARAAEPALAANIAGAMRFADDHQVDPRSLTAILLRYLDAELIREQAIEVLREAGTISGVRLASGRVVEGQCVVLATGLGALAGAPALPLRPVYGDIVRLRPHGGRPLIEHTVRGIVNRRPVYLVPRRDGSLVLGASSREDGRAEVNVGALHTLLDDARRLVPGVADASLLEVIARARPGTEDDVPIIERVEQGLVVSTGYFRHGILLTPFAAKATATLATGGQLPAAQQTTLSLSRFTGGHLPAQPVEAT
ncbi:glycine oxidase ThiO [Glutamicibacter endophyticus]